jgi:enamine deaminase RidA (YjgF/YER057c/UK114 family)
MILIEPADLDAKIELARELFREYAARLGVDLCFQDFERELRELPAKYAPPAGRLLLAYEYDANGKVAAGCGALRPIDAAICEMKRLYVRQEFRGCGLGRTLAESLIASARELGYTAMRLDTLPSMREAHKLYDQLGFREIAPYYASPVAGTRFLALNLSPEDARVAPLRGKNKTQRRIQMPLRKKTQKRRFVIRPDRKGDWPFSDGVWVGQTFYLSGHLGLDPATRKPPAEPAREIRLMLDMMKATLKAAGLEMKHLAFVQVFCADVSLFSAFNTIYREYFVKNFPARTFIGSGALLYGARFEIQGIASRD